MRLLLAAAASADQFDLRKLQVHRDGDRLRYSYGDKDVSPWHDVPFWADADKTLVHFVCEIPRLTRSKTGNPQERRGQQARPGHEGPAPALLQVQRRGRELRGHQPDLGGPGRGRRAHGRRRRQRPHRRAPAQRGAVRARRRTARPRARRAGARRRRETDWKLLVVDADDAATGAWRTVDDIPRDRVAEARDWYRLYKTAEGKGENDRRHGRPRHRRRRARPRVAVGTPRRGCWR